jgi:hypothetical protein
MDGKSILGVSIQGFRANLVMSICVSDGNEYRPALKALKAYEVYSATASIGGNAIQ